MSADLAARLQELRLADGGDHVVAPDWIDEHLLDRVPSSPLIVDPEIIKADLARRHLVPPTSLAGEKWLNKLQQRWHDPPDYTELQTMAPTMSRTVTRFTRAGLEGRVTGYQEVTIPGGNSATARNSTSFARKPASKADFVRGAAGFFPFAPGGLDALSGRDKLVSSDSRGDILDDLLGREGEEMEREERRLRQEKSSDERDTKRRLERILDLNSDGGLLTVAPGFQRGMVIKTEKRRSEKLRLEAEDVETLLQQEPGSMPPDAGSVDVKGDEVSESDSKSDGDSDTEDIDSMLPVEFPALQPHGALAPSSQARAGRDYAHMVDISHSMTNFHELVPDPARVWPFELDAFQKEAVYHLECGDSVFVAAHTSAGKTVVAEYAIALAAKHMTKAIYTSPIKALSNQKFRDFRTIFDEVGILTGDVQINPEASCLIMTTEILRSMLYRGADLIRDVEFVIFDEVHYVNDQERGVVWEEVIIMLPEHVTLILLSATVPNTYEFASWVGRTKKKDIYVISTAKRPVPLEHFLWADKDIHKIVDADKKFLEQGWKKANDVLGGRDKVKAAPTAEPAKSSSNVPRGRGQNARGGGSQRGGPPQRGRGGAQRASHTPGHMGRGGRTGNRTTVAQDKTLWVHLVQYMKKENLLPSCIFVFSKKRCEENAEALSNQDFCTAAEKSAIYMITEKSLARLKPDDRQLPQILRLRDLLGRGIAVHHGGLLPIVKELVELLFAQTLVKVLFATETFAMGLNLPTRTVVFSGYRKHDGTAFRNLLPGEYTQMAGRAGRRGLDTVGSVIIVPPAGVPEAPPVTELRTMILGEPSKLRSQFRLTYNMILNLLRVEALKIEEMIKRSFSEHATQQLLPEHEKQISLSEADLAKVKREACSVCDPDLELCHQACQEFVLLTVQVHTAILSLPVGRRMFVKGRLVVYKRDGMRCVGLLVRDGVAVGGGMPTMLVCEIRQARPVRGSTDLLPYLPAYRRYYAKLPPKKQIHVKNFTVAVNDLECLTQSVVKGIVPEIWNGGEPFERAKAELARICTGWDLPEWDELDWNARMKSMNVKELLNKRTIEAKKAEDAACLECEDFVKHFAMRHDEWLIKENISQLRQLMSDQNLQLLPDYEQRIQVLKELDFIDDSSRVQLKGKVACEIHTTDSPLLTEIILENVLSPFTPSEIAALLSSFVFQEKSQNMPSLTPNLQRGITSILTLSQRIDELQTKYQIILPASSHGTRDSGSGGGAAEGRTSSVLYAPQFALAEVVHAWAEGVSFRAIMDLTDVMEGTVVRTVSRLDECCREVRGAARVVGDTALWTKMGECMERLRRDVVGVGSLYL